MNNYNADFYAWAQQQAELLKAGRLSELDLENLIEEVEDMSKSEKRALENRLIVLLVHLLKWRYQPQRQGNSWRLPIKEQRTRLFKLLKSSPSLKSQLDFIVADAYDVAIFKAAKETQLDENSFPESCPWTIAQILDADYYPDTDK